MSTVHTSQAKEVIYDDIKYVFLGYKQTHVQFGFHKRTALWHVINYIIFTRSDR